MLSVSIHPKVITLRGFSYLICWFCLSTDREWVEEIVEAPRDDHVVVAADDASDDGRSEPDSAEARVNRLPDSERALPELLTDPEFEQEERHALKDHHD